MLLNFLYCTAYIFLRWCSYTRTEDADDDVGLIEKLPVNYRLRGIAQLRCTVCLPLDWLEEQLAGVGIRVIPAVNNLVTILRSSATSPGEAILTFNTVAPKLM